MQWPPASLVANLHLHNSSKTLIGGSCWLRNQHEAGGAGADHYPTSKRDSRQKSYKFKSHKINPWGTPWTMWQQLRESYPPEHWSVLPLFYCYERYPVWHRTPKLMTKLLRCWYKRITEKCLQYSHRMILKSGQSTKTSNDPTLLAGYHKWCASYCDY